MGRTSDRTVDGRTTLMVAAHQGKLEVVRLLCDHGADLSDHEGCGLTALMAAARKGHLDVVRFLCDPGPDWSDRQEDGHMA